MKDEMAPVEPKVFSVRDMLAVVTMVAKRVRLQVQAESRSRGVAMSIGGHLPPLPPGWPFDKSSELTEERAAELISASVKRING